MIRFLLSLLALVSGVAVPGMADARAYGACGTEIGAAVQIADAAGEEVCESAALPMASRPVTRRPVIKPRALAFAAPAPATVLIGIDRARE